MRKSAFTLIELLVTIVLFSLLLAIALYSFRFVSINMRNINNTNPQKAINYDLLRRVLGSIYPYVEMDLKENSFYYYFKGEDKKCRFITKSPIFYRGVAMGELDYSDGKVIYEEGKIFDKEVDYSDLNAITLNKRITIIDNVKDVKFVYFLDGDKKVEILKEIPNLIKIEFKKDEKEREYLFSIKSDNTQQIDMTQYQYRII